MLAVRRKPRIARGLAGDRRMPLLVGAMLGTLPLCLGMRLDIVPDSIPIPLYLNELVMMLGGAWIFRCLATPAVLEALVPGLDAGKEG